MNKKKYNPLLLMVLMGIACTLWMAIYSKLAVGWDHEAHIKVAKWLLVPEIEYKDLVSPERMTHAFGYPLAHILIKIVRLISAFDYEICLAIVLTLANVLSVYMYRKIILKQLKLEYSYYVDFVSVGLLIFMCARCWLNNWGIYYLQAGANPIHNPTIVVCRPFGLMAFYYFCAVFEKTEIKDQNKNIIIFSLALILSILAKPSFAFVLVPAIGIYILIYMIKSHDYKLVCKLVLSGLPAGLIMIGQFIYIRMQAEILNTIFIHFGTFYSFSIFKVFGITLVNIPVAVIMFRWNRIKDKLELKLAGLTFIIAWIQQYFLTNGGSNDFVWGFNLSIGLLTAVFVGEAKFEKNDSNAVKVRKVLAILVFIYQMYVGLTYIKLGYMVNSYRM